MDAFLEYQRKQGQSGVLRPDDPNHLWTNECKRVGVTMDSLMEVIGKTVNGQAANVDRINQID